MLLPVDEIVAETLVRPVPSGATRTPLTVNDPEITPALMLIVRTPAAVSTEYMVGGSLT
jgi:hypothetical protein